LTRGALSRRDAVALMGAAALLAPGGARSRPLAKVRVPKDAPTVADAFAALPEGGGVIELAPGIYREKLVLTKPNVSLIGRGRNPEDVVIVWGDSAKMAGGTGKSASFTVSGDGFSARNLTIQNDYHLNNPDPSQAVALSITSDRATLRDVRLLGAQDTLYAASKKPTEPSRQYYRDCYIEGHVDFIFGNALAFFDRCCIHVLSRENAFITAHSGTAPTETSAYVFDRCTITADSPAGDIYFGRAWRPYAQVVFLDTRIEAPLHVEGWREWTPGKTETYKTAAFAEYGSTGPGASTAMRVFWAQSLTAQDATRWRLNAVFPDRSWIRR
jgi:pectinesterase